MRRRNQKGLDEGRSGWQRTGTNGRQDPLHSFGTGQNDFYLLFFPLHFKNLISSDFFQAYFLLKFSYFSITSILDPTRIIKHIFSIPKF